MGSAWKPLRAAVRKSKRLQAEEAAAADGQTCFREQAIASDARPSACRRRSVRTEATTTRQLKTGRVTTSMARTAIENAMAMGICSKATTRRQRVLTTTAAATTAQNTTMTVTRSWVTRTLEPQVAATTDFPTIASVDITEMAQTRSIPAITATTLTEEGTTKDMRIRSTPTMVLWIVSMATACAQTLSTSREWLPKTVYSSQLLAACSTPPRFHRRVL
mmetsp:Transcript_2116/g.5642  ORF Transcript_2116/g.5642 Transcript_2116/m.5642 type:complete len:219 (+) Transcript_2116:619-1275(+)